MADALNLAWVYSGLGQNDQVFEWLEWAYQDRNVDLALLNVIEGFEQACSDPRFQDLIQRMNFPP